MKNDRSDAFENEPELSEDKKFQNDFDNAAFMFQSILLSGKISDEKIYSPYAGYAQMQISSHLHYFFFALCYHKIPRAVF